MKIASISTTKNECDVIEAFVRHNARFCDKFFFIDESHDATRAILSSLHAEGFDITIFSSSSTNYDQCHLITSALRHVDSLGEIDWVMLLDGDEIVPDVTREEFEQVLSLVPAAHLAALAWQTYIPQTRDYFTFNDPLVENFLPRLTEATQAPIHKVFVPKALFSVASIDPGNHGAQHATLGTRIPAVQLPMRLGHFPVRSPEQIIVKNIIATHNLSMKENKTAVEGWHVYQALAQLRANGFVLTYDELKRVAVTYAAAETSGDLPVELGAAPIRAQAVEMKYISLRYRNIVSALDSELEIMAKRVLAYKQVISKTKASLGGANEHMGQALAALASAETKAT
jgi:hypothetical protein